MQPDEGELAYLWDMHRLASEVEQLVAGAAYDEFVIDWQKRRAAERRIEIIGEAAGRVSSRFRDAPPEISRRGLIAQRNVLAHQYGDIRIDAIWRVATIRIPELLLLLRPMLRHAEE